MKKSTPSILAFVLFLLVVSSCAKEIKAPVKQVQNKAVSMNAVSTTPTAPSGNSGCGNHSGGPSSNSGY